MMLASEAVKKSDEVIRSHLTDELKRIDFLIDRAVMSGERRASFDGNISKNARAELERLGYKVKTGSQYNQEWVIIEW